MSTLVVEVCEVLSVDPHPQADALEFITVKGWRDYHISVKFRE